MTTAKEYQQKKLKLFEAVNNIAREMPLRNEDDKIAIKNAICGEAQNILQGDGFDKIEVITKLMQDKSIPNVSMHYYAYVTCWLSQSFNQDPMEKLVPRVYKVRTRSVPNLVTLAAQAVNKAVGSVGRRDIMFEEEGDLAERFEIPVECAKHLKHNFCRKFDKEFMYPICNTSTFQSTFMS